jgi:hypothetical protein
MPKFVYLKGQFGVFPQIWHDNSVLGVAQKMPTNIIAVHNISDNEAEFSLDLLSTIYPRPEVKDATDE